MQVRSFFSGFIAALIGGLPLSLGLVYFAADHIETLLSFLAVFITLVVILVCLAVAFRGWIFAQLRLKLDAALQDTISPASSAINHIIDGDRPAAIADLGRTANALASWYVQVDVNRWMMAILIALLAAFAAILGSALLARQNSFIVAQLQASTLLDLTRTSREYILKAWEVSALRPLVDPSAGRDDEKRLEGFVNVLIQHHITAYMNAKLGYLAQPYVAEIERETEGFLCMPAVQKAWAQRRDFHPPEVRHLGKRCQ